MNKKPIKVNANLYMINEAAFKWKETEQNALVLKKCIFQMLHVTTLYSAF